MKKLTLLSIVSLLALCSCQQELGIQVRHNTQALAMTNPDLLNATQSIVALLFHNQAAQNRCDDMLVESIDDIETRGVVNVKVFSSTAERGEVFGLIRAGGDYSVLMLGSTKALVQDEADVVLENAKNSVIASGCHEVTLTQEENENIAITLFASGIR